MVLGHVLAFKPIPFLKCLKKSERGEEKIKVIEDKNWTMRGVRNKLERSELDHTLSILMRETAGFHNQNGRCRPSS
jgi:hypothetical protein